MRWRLVVLGLGLAVASGVYLAQALLRWNADWYLAGALLLLAAVLIVIAEIPLSRQTAGIGPGSSRTGEQRAGRVELGEILVSDGLITRSQLEQALARHRECGRPLGEVLVRMGVITMLQLFRALNDQCVRHERGFVWHG